MDADWTRPDALAFAKVVLAAQGALYARYWGFWTFASRLAAVVLAGGLVFLVTGSANWATAASLAAIAFVVAGQWAHWLDGNRAQDTFIGALFERDPEAYEPRRWSIEAEALVERRALVESRVRWSKIKEVTRESGLVLVWLTLTDAMAVPERCFPTSAEADAFVAEMRARIGAASPDA